MTLVPVEPFDEANGTMNRVPFPSNPGTMPMRDSFSSTNPGPETNDEDTPVQPAVFEQYARSAPAESTGMEPVRRLESKVTNTSREYRLKALVTLTVTAKLLPLEAVVTVGLTERLASPEGAADTPAAQLIMLRSRIAAPGWCW
jgi:hypothetical protein